jgi:hypothetical protein
MLDYKSQMAFKSNAKPIYQPWNEEVFNADVHVRAMLPIQRWMYRTLCQAMFFHTTRPYLPNDDEILWVLAGCESIEQWMTYKEKVMRRFTPLAENPQLLENNRVNQDWERMVESRQRYSRMGQQSAQSRSSKGSTCDEPTLNVGDTKRREVKEKGKRREKKEALPPQSSNPPEKPNAVGGTAELPLDYYEEV